MSDMNNLANDIIRVQSSSINSSRVSKRWPALFAGCGYLPMLLGAAAGRQLYHVTPEFIIEVVEDGRAYRRNYRVKNIIA